MDGLAAARPPEAEHACLPQRPQSPSGTTLGIFNRLSYLKHRGSFKQSGLCGNYIMSKKASWMKKRQSESAQAKTQQRNRRKRSLFKKAKEFVLECESDVFLAVRVRKSGQMYIFDSSTRNQWLKDLSNLVRLTWTLLNESCGSSAAEFTIIGVMLPSSDPRIDGCSSRAWRGSFRSRR